MDIAASFSQALRTFGFNQLLENTLLVKLIEFFIIIKDLCPLVLSKCFRCISFYRLNCRICDVSRSVPENY